MLQKYKKLLVFYSSLFYSKNHNSKLTFSPDFAFKSLNEFQPRTIVLVILNELGIVVNFK